MQGIIHLLRGHVTMEAEGAYPERLLNLLAQERVPFWGLEWRSPTCFQVRIFRRDRRRVRGLARRAMCDLRETHRRGVPFLLGRMRRRYALLGGFVCFLLAVLVLSRVILAVEVTGNETVPTPRIQQELRLAGVHFGVYGPALDTNAVKHKVLLAMPELSWLTVNLSGSKAEVIVRERQPVPEIVDERTPMDLLAERDGLITRMEVLRGEEQVAPGSTVITGDVLVRGIYEVQRPEGGTVDLGTRRVRAMARIYARTWRTLTLETPLTVTGKAYTGPERTRYALLWGIRRINFYPKGGILPGNYDKMTIESSLRLPGDVVLPVTLIREILRPYEPVERPLDRASAERLLTERLTATLKADVGDDGEVTEQEITVEERNGLLLVTLRAECEEQIGKSVPAREPEHSEENT